MKKKNMTLHGQSDTAISGKKKDSSKKLEYGCIKKNNSKVSLNLNQSSKSF